MAAHYTPKFRFILADKEHGRFPKTSNSLIDRRELTDTLAQTYVFDDRDSPELKKTYYNILYKGIAEFDAIVIEV